jgi:putative MATE family efflux protein
MNQAEKKDFNVQFWRFLWASILIGLSACLGNVVDAMIVGNLIDEDAVSAINLSLPLLQFMYTVNMLLATGAGMLVGMELGKGDSQRASYIFIVSMAACLVTGLMLTACGVLTPDVVTRLLCDNEQLYQPTYDYLRVMLIGAPAYLLMWGVDTMVSVDGSPRLVSVSILVDNVVHLVLDVVLIKYFGFGIEGSAWAAVIGHVVGIAMMGIHFLSKENHLKFFAKQSGRAERKICRAKNSTLKKIISQGAPLAIASICLTVLMFASNKIILSSLGRTGIYAFALCMNLLLIYNLFLGGVCRTIQSLGSIQVGKGDNEAFTLVLRKSFNFITVAMVITCIYVWIWPESIVMLFGTDEDEMIIESCRALRIFAVCLIPFCYIYTIMIVYKLYNYHHMALFISFALSLTVIPVLWLFSWQAKEWIWYGFLTAYIIEMVAIFVLHKMTHVRFELGVKN